MSALPPEEVLSDLLMVLDGQVPATAACRLTTLTPLSWAVDEPLRPEKLLLCRVEALRLAPH